MNKITDFKRKKLWFEQELVRFIHVFEIQALHKKQFKTTVGRKKIR